LGHAGFLEILHDVINDASGFKCQTSFTTSAAGCPYTRATCAYPCRRTLDYQRINFGQIANFVELSSVGNSATNNTGGGGLNAHVHDTNSQASTTLASTFGATMVSDMSSGKQLPATSSAQTVISHLPQQNNVGVVVLADYANSFAENYNGDTDSQFSNDTVQGVCQAANTIGQAAFTLVTGNNSGSDTPPTLPGVNCSLVQELMYCLIQNFSCPLVTAFQGQSTSGISRISHYSIFQFGQVHPISQFVFRYMYNLTATSTSGTCQQPSDCKLGQACLFGKCASGLTHMHEAYGAGLQLQASGLFTVVNSSLPVWTESTWNIIGFRLFTMSSTIADVVQLLVGLIITAVTLVVVYISRKFLRKTLKIR